MFLVLALLLTQVSSPTGDADSASATDPKVATADLPQQIQQGQLQLRETESTIQITHGGRSVLVYNKQSPSVPEGIPPIYHRSGFLHPVASPAGRVVTAAFPADHPHQHGIFTAWVKTTWNDRPIDFWNLAGGTGRVLHHRVVSLIDSPGKLGFEADLIHRAEQPPATDVLQERWKLTVSATDGSYHQFDLETTQTALTEHPLVVHPYHYGGVAVRGPVDWLSDRDRDTPADQPDRRQPSRFVNDQAAGRIEANGKPTRWVSMIGTVDGQPVTITVMGHPVNFRAAQPVRVHPTKPYFCFAACIAGEFRIDRQHPLHGRYRYLITDAPPDQSWIQQQWQSWVDQP